MVDKQTTADQHYVPKFYLKQFADASGFVQVIDAKELRLGKARPFGSVCYDRFFYAAEPGKADEISQAFEDAFGAMETQFAAAMPDVIERLHSQSALDADFDMLALFMSMQWQRTGYFRKVVNSIQDQATRHIMRFSASNPEHLRTVLKKAGHEGTDEEVEQVRATFTSDDYNLTFNNAAHLQFISGESLMGFRNLLFFKKWNVLRASEGARFITTDNPVAEWIPDLGFYGAGFPQRTHHLALTPELLVVSAPADEGGLAPMTQPVLERINYRDVGDDETVMFNILLLSHSERYGYSQRRRDLEDLMKSRNTQNEAMKLYIERYWSKQARNRAARGARSDDPA